MAVYKNESNNTWYVMTRYQDWTGERKQKCKRGFKTKREAMEWENQFQLQKRASVNMTMESFCKLYEEDVKPGMKRSTWLTKESIIRSKIIPYLGQRKVSEITAKDVIDWQNAMRKLKNKSGKPIAPTYLKTIHGQLSAIFNHAMKFYDLAANPAQKAGTMGAEESKEMEFWTKEEYLKFSEAMMDKPISYYAFELLYWCGVREGELLALNLKDVDLEKRTISITKSYQRLGKKDVVSPPKTPKSKRVITIPEFLATDIKDYMDSLYDLQENDRLFPITKYYLEHEMQRGIKESGVKRIRVHDLRHSHASMLIELGFSPLEIANRLGHEKVETTLNTYAHLYPNKQTKLAERLDSEYREDL